MKQPPILGFFPPAAPLRWTRGGLWKVRSEQDGTDVCVRREIDDRHRKVSFEWYEPRNEEPQLYLCFANLGRAAWEAFDGAYVLEWDTSPPLSDDIKQKVIEFHVDYGQPLRRLGDHSSGLVTVHEILHHAQVIDLVVAYQKVIQADAMPASLRTRLRAVDRRDRDGTLGFELETDEGVLRAAETLILWEGSHKYALGGLSLALDPAFPDDPSMPLAWGLSVQPDQLLNVIWFQAVQTLIRKSLVRTCRNEHCQIGLFEAERPNQYYCSPKCRNYHNTQKFRRKPIGKSDISDLLA